LFYLFSKRRNFSSASQRKKRMAEVTKLVVPTPSTPIPDWDPNCQAAYGFQSYWLVYAALWWSSHDRTLFVTASKKVPPFDAFSDRDENAEEVDYNEDSSIASALYGISRKSIAPVAPVAKTPAVDRSKPLTRLDLLGHVPMPPTHT